MSVTGRGPHGQERTLGISTAVALTISVRVPDIAMELPGVADALPDHDVLSRYFSCTAATRNTENEYTDLTSYISPGIDLDGMKFINLHP